MKIDSESVTDASNNRLVEALQYAGNSKGGVTIVVYEKGSVHIDHADRPCFFGDSSSGLPASADVSDTDRKLPPVLSTEKAMTVWQKLQQAGYVDENYQPKLSRTQAAVLAKAVAEYLEIKNKWKVFEKLWNRKGMYGDYYLALGQKQSLLFQDSLNKLLR